MGSLKESLLSPKPKEISKQKRLRCSLFSSCKGPSAAQIVGQMRSETVLDYTSLGYLAKGTAALAPGHPPGLGGDKCGSVAPKVGLL